MYANVTVAVLSFSTLGLLILLAICMPLNKYRTAVFSSMVVFAIGMGTALWFLKALDFNGFGFNHVAAILFNVAISYAVYLILYLVVRKHKISEKFIDKFVDKVEENEVDEDDEEERK